MEQRLYDLDLPLSTMNSQFLARVLDAGYHCIALSQDVTVDDFNFSLKTENEVARKKTKEERQSMRASLLTQLKPSSSETLNRLLSESHKYRSAVWSPSTSFVPRLFRRLNIQCTEPSLASLFFREFGEHLKHFDLVSICPTSEEALSYVCEQTPPVDLITLDPTKSGDLRLNSKQCSVIHSRGLHLEFKWNCIIQHGSAGSNARSAMSRYLTSLFAAVRPSVCKSIVFSSGVTCAWDVRRPVSVVAMLQCLGLQPKHVAQLALTANPYSAIAHGLWRSRTAHGAVALLKLLPNPSVVSIEDIRDEHKAGSDPPPSKKRCLTTDVK